MAVSKLKYSFAPSRYGASIDISGYTSSDFVVPSAGIVQVSVGFNRGSYCYIANNQDGTSQPIINVSNCATAGMVGYTMTSAPVFKGMSLRVTKSSTDSQAFFIPYE